MCRHAESERYSSRSGHVQSSARVHQGKNRWRDFRRGRGGLGCWPDALDAGAGEGGAGCVAPPGIPLCIAADLPPALGEVGPLPFPPPPDLGGAPPAPDEPPPDVREPAATASFTFDNASEPRVAYCVATTPAPAAARPTPIPTLVKSPPLMEATPPSIAEEIFGDIQQTHRNMTAAAARSNPVRAGSIDVAAFCATSCHPCDSVIPAPIRRYRTKSFMPTDTA